MSSEIDTHLGNIRALQSPSGLFLASARGVPTGYDKAWLRDNFYTVLAFEEVGDWDTVRKTWRAVLDILKKHEAKIDWAAAHKPHATYQYIHARYNPDTFEEFWDEWGNKQNDAVGAVLYTLARLSLGRDVQSIIESDDDRRVIQRLVAYLVSIEYWHDPDNGVWEEYEEVHASSIGACVAGLKAAAALPFVTIPEGSIEKGEEALASLLPRESRSKFCDLAELSLIWPYRVTTDEEVKTILKNLEYHLVRDRGAIRYKQDRYYNANSDAVSEEAEWTMAFPWLAIIYHERGERLKAEHYLDRARSVLTPDGMMPELYFSNSPTPNENIPLGWAESLLVIALRRITG